MNADASPDIRLHFLLRYSDALRGIGTIAEHERILEKCGYVWMGKFGLGVSAVYVEKAAKQIQADRLTWVYLATQGQIRHRAQVVEVVGGGVAARIRSPNPRATPSYYANTLCSVWFRLIGLTKTQPGEIGGLRLYNCPTLAPATTGMRGLIYVTTGSGKVEERHPVPKRGGGKNLVDDGWLDALKEFDE